MTFKNVLRLPARHCNGTGGVEKEDAVWSEKKLERSIEISFKNKYIYDNLNNIKKSFLLRLY